MKRVSIEIKGLEGLRYQTGYRMRFFKVGSMPTLVHGGQDEVSIPLHHSAADFTEAGIITPVNQAGRAGKIEILPEAFQRPLPAGQKGIAETDLVIGSPPFGNVAAQGFG
jgi:hypothetical protein